MDQPVEAKVVIGAADSLPDAAARPTSARQAALRGRGSGRSQAATAFLVLILHTACFAQSASAPGQREIAEGVQLLRSGQSAQALDRFNTAVRAAPRSADALTWRGVCENQTQQYTAAATDFRAALRIDPSMLAAHYNLALSLIRLHETDGAIEQLRLVVRAQPTSVQPLYNLAVLLEAKGLVAEAVRNLEAAHALAPDDSGVTLHLLTDSLTLKDAGRVPSLLGPLEAESTQLEVQRQAGAALLEAGRFDDALALLKIAHAREPGHPETDTLLARAWIGHGDNAEAIALLAGSPGAISTEEGRYLMGLAHTEARAFQEAADDFEVAARMDPKDARPLYHLGLIASAKPGGEADAIRLLRSASQMDPKNPAYSDALARVLLASDQAEEARSVLAAAPQAGTNDAQRRTLMGAALAALHQIPQATAELRKAVEEDPALALAHNILGFCLLQQGQYAQAAVAYGKASELDPARLLYARDAARASERAGKPDEALRFAERATALGGASAPDHALLGKLYAGAGRRDDAVRELTRAAELDPDLDSAVYLLARTYMQMGDQARAAQWSEKLAALKERHQAEFALQKTTATAPVRSSTLLEGGAMSAEASTP